MIVLTPYFLRLVNLYRSFLPYANKRVDCLATLFISLGNATNILRQNNSGCRFCNYTG
jgi:hypothetical protein